MTRYIHHAYYLSIDIRENDVELINFSEDDKAYHLDLFKFNQLMRAASNRWEIIPCADGSTLEMAYNKYNRHIYSADGKIDAYFRKYEYELLLTYLSEKERENIQDMSAKDYEYYYGSWIDD